MDDKANWESLHIIKEKIRFVGQYSINVENNLKGNPLRTGETIVDCS